MRLINTTVQLLYIDIVVCTLLALRLIGVELRT